MRCAPELAGDVLDGALCERVGEPFDVMQGGDVADCELAGESGAAQRGADVVVG